jgi:hypothetical protein
MPRSASVGGLAKRGVIPRKQFYTNLFLFNTVILVGSHVLFLTSVVRDTVPVAARELQLFHSFSSYRQYLAMK